MRNTLLLAATAAATLFATPALAQPYVGVSGGILFPKDQDIDLTFDALSTTIPRTTFKDAVGIDYKRGYDVDANFGYDFGMFRLEGELGYKRAKLDNLELSSAFRSALQADLGRTVNAETEFDLSGRTSVMSGMLNGLVDFGSSDSVNFFAGGGVGRARVKFAGDRDTAWAYQLLAGVRAPVSDNIDLGLKYRYFQTAKLNFFGPGSGSVFGTGGNAVFANADNKFRSHSLLASLTVNLGAPAAAPMVEAAPAPMVEAAPPPPPPATQTCWDGSVILATDMCPMQPAAPPPPPPAPVRG